jgi:NAD(P) transhydrogenase
MKSTGIDNRTAQDHAALPRLEADFIVIGAGPAGQKAAVQAAKAGRRVVLVEREGTIGGECVHRGTIPSKSLRQRAVDQSLRFRPGDVLEAALPSLLGEVREIVAAHTRYMLAQLERNGIRVLHGQAVFLDEHRLRIDEVGGGAHELHGEHIVICTGSVPRRPADVPVDHEHILDSDSILSLAYLPQSLIVLGGGVIACEYASIFALLGVRVTMIDRNPRPLMFMDAELTDHFVAALRRRGGDFLGGVGVRGVEWDEIAAVQVRLDDGRTLEAEKVLSALGRVARLDGLHVERAGLAVDARGVLPVSPWGQTARAHIYAAGDVIGPPSLASASMEQGRRAARHALGLELHGDDELIPSGVYAVPELACVGLTEDAARARDPGVVVGRANFEEIARGQIAYAREGLLKMVAGSDGRVLGVHIVGEAATELVHVGQLAMLGGANADAFIDHVFNFPTFAEAYRVAALQIARQLLARRQAEAADPLAELAAQRVAELASLVAGGSPGIDTRTH